MQHYSLLVWLDTNLRGRLDSIWSDTSTVTYRDIADESLLNDESKHFVLVGYWTRMLSKPCGLQICLTEKKNVFGGLF